MPLPGHSWLLRNCLSTSVRRRKSGSYPAFFSETSERKGHAYITEPPTPELGVFSANTTPKVSSRPHPKVTGCLKCRIKINDKSDLFKKWEKNKNFGATLAPTLRILLGRRRENRPTFAKKTNMFYHPVSVHHRGWVGLAVGCTRRTMGLYVSPCKKLYVFTQYYASSYIRKYVYRIFARSNA